MQKGDYVMASKYVDGDPGDHWCVGYYDAEMPYYTPPRHNIVDGNGQRFRANGFRRVELITTEEGEWMIAHMSEIDKAPMYVIEMLTGEDDQMGGKSVWEWLADARSAHSAKPDLAEAGVNESHD